MGITSFQKPMNGVQSNPVCAQHMVQAPTGNPWLLLSPQPGAFLFYGWGWGWMFPIQGMLKDQPRLSRDQPGRTSRMLKVGTPG
jgi:hypothetical protein